VGDTRMNKIIVKLASLQPADRALIESLYPNLVEVPTTHVNSPVVTHKEKDVDVALSEGPGMSFISFHIIYPILYNSL
jgi:hypothetical protein